MATASSREGKRERTKSGASAAILEGVELDRFWKPKPEPSPPPSPPSPPALPEFWFPGTQPGDFRRTPEDVVAIADTIKHTIWRLEKILSHGELEHTRRAAARALADVAHNFFITWPPKEHVRSRFQRLYEKNTEFKARWNELGKRGRRKRGDFRNPTVESRIYGFATGLNLYVTGEVCGVGFYASTLDRILEPHDYGEHERITFEFRRRNGLGREMQSFLEEGQEDYNKLVEQGRTATPPSLGGWSVLPQGGNKISENQLLAREAVRRFDEYWRRIIRPVWRWALPLWLEDLRDWKDSNGESLPQKRPPSKWEKLMKSALRHSLVSGGIAASLLREPGET